MLKVDLGELLFKAIERLRMKVLKFRSTGDESGEASIFNIIILYTVIINE